MSDGWVKLHRCLFNKAIWRNSTPEQKVVLVTLLGMANHAGREWEWKGKQFKAEPGMLVTSVDSICDKCGKGITTQNVRTALKKFEKYEFLTQEVTKTGRLINIVNWLVYQGQKETINNHINNELTNTSQTPNKDLTNTSQTPNKQLTTNKNDKNIKNDKEGKEREEREEEVPSLQPLFFPTPIHSKIYEQFGEIGYRTFFMEAEIKETDKEVIITHKDKFIESMIMNEWVGKLKIILGKKVKVGG